jgi:tetratricopeptide (TPR) repeat protein
MLTFLSFSSPSHIFTELLQSTYKTTSGILASMIFVPASDTSLKGTLDDGFKALELYSLLQWNDQDEAYSMHKLVQTWAFERLKSDEQVTFCFAASNYLEHLCWSSGDPSALQRRLISHVMPCFVKVRALCHAGSLATEDVVELVSSLAWFLFTAGKFDFAYALQDFCHKCHEQQHLVDPIAYAGSLHCLARCLFGQHKYDTAEPLLRQVLDRRDEPLFGEHVRIKESCQSSLALLLIDRDRSCSEAEQMLRCLLDQQWHRNASEIDKVNTMIILASALMGRKRHIEAENLYRRMLERPRELSSEFQNAVPTYLSKAFRLQGKFAEAEIVAQQESEHALIHGATNSRSQRALMALGKVKLANP